MFSSTLPDQMQLVDVADLVPSARNARTHSKKQISELAGSIQRFGFIVPMLVDEHRMIIAGHARVLAAKKLGLQRLPVIVIDHLSEAEKRAYALADNKIALNADWDDTLLRVELEALKTEGMDLALVGFSEEEFKSLIDQLESGIRIGDEDEAPEAQTDTVSRAGDLWIMGRHKLLCGDSLDDANLVTLLNGQPADMVFTDPPYNVAYTAPGSGVTIANDDQGPAFASFLNRACANILRHTRGACYICMSSSELYTLYKAFTDAGGHWSTFVIWGKNTFTLGRSDYHRQYEPILYGWRDGQPHHWCGARDQGDLWLFDKPHTNDLHPTMKPVELVERAVLNSSRRDELVLDPFAGSGSTLIASEKTGRIARLIELEPKYCDVIVRRWQEFTGQQAKLSETGFTFDEITARRDIRAGENN